MTTKKVAGSQKSIATIVIYLLLLAALGTAALPLLRVNMPPIGQTTVSLLDMGKSVVKLLPQSSTAEKESAWQFGKKPEFDFFELLEKVSPKDPQTQTPKKISVAFVLGALVPVALLLAYLLTALGLVLALIGGGALGWCAAVSVLCAVYAFGGTMYLGRAAEASFQASMTQAAEGVFGGIAKNFVPRLTIQPDSALYALVALTLVIFLMNQFAKKNA